MISGTVCHCHVTTCQMVSPSVIVMRQHCHSCCFCAIIVIWCHICLCLSATLSPCQYYPISLSYCVNVILCHVNPVSLPSCVTDTLHISPNISVTHPVSVSPCACVTMSVSPCVSVTVPVSPCVSVALCHFRYVSLSPCVSVALSHCHCVSVLPCVCVTVSVSPCVSVALRHCHYVERHGSGVELRTLNYENPASNPVLRC